MESDTVVKKRLNPITPKKRLSSVSPKKRLSSISPSRSFSLSKSLKDDDSDLCSNTSSIGGVLDYDQYISFKRNGSLSFDRERMNYTNVNGAEEENEKGHGRKDRRECNQNGQSAGKVSKFYNSFGDYWNLFPKTDYIYSPSSRDYGKEIVPGIPAMPNLARRSLRTGCICDLPNCAGDCVNRRTWVKKFSSQIIRVITKTVTTVTTTCTTVTRTIIHPKESPCRTALFLVLLLIPLIYYLIFHSDKHFFNYFPKVDVSVPEIFYKMFTPIYQILSYFLFLIKDTVKMAPIFIYQAVLSWTTVLNQQKDLAAVRQPIFEPHLNTLTAQEIRRIILDVLAEREKNGGLIDADNRDEKVVEITKRVLGTLIKDVNTNVDNIKNSLEDKEENIKKIMEEQIEIKQHLKGLEEKLITTQVQISTQTELDNNNESYSLSTQLRQELIQIVENVLAKYHADRTGMPDYALMSNGGVILSVRCTTTYTKHRPEYTLFGFSIWSAYSTPDIIIKPGMMPGECWAFEGSEGYVAIGLAMPIYISGFTMEHTPKELTHYGHINSAPNRFTVYGLKHIDDKEPLFLGEFRFLENKGSLQSFSALKVDEPFHIIELRILSNHGNLDYTCLYRFRVHGMPVA